MILYKYLQPERLDVLSNKTIRFTQPGGFNDPFEFRPQIENAASKEEIKASVEKNWEKLLEAELSKYGALVEKFPPGLIREMVSRQKHRIPEFIQFLQPEFLKAMSPA